MVSLKPLIVAILVTLAVCMTAAEEAVCDQSQEECVAEQQVNKKNAAPTHVKRYPLQHALGGSKSERDLKFVSRGELEVSLSKKSKRISIKFSSKTYELSKEEVLALKALVESDGYYRVRLPLNPEEGDGQWLYTSIRACQFVHNGFKESFRFHLDKSGSITSIELQALHDSLGTDTCPPSVKIQHPISIRSKATASLPREAHIAKAEVLGATNIKKSNLPQDLQQQLGSSGMAPSKKKDKSKEDEEESPTSFLRKYWYIFLPVALMTMMGGAQPQDEAGPQGRKQR